MHLLLCFIVLITQLCHSQCTKANDDLFAYFHGGFDKNFEGEAKLTIGDWVEAFFVALVVNVPLLLITTFLVDARRFTITFAVISGNCRLFCEIMSVLKCNKKLVYVKLTMLNSPLLTNVLNLRQPLTTKQLKHLIVLFDEYFANIKAQGNEAVIFWLDFKLIIQQQHFCARMIPMRFYSDHELMLMVRRARAKLHFIEKMAPIQLHIPRSQVIAESALGERQRSKFELLWSNLEEKVKHNVDPRRG